MGEGLEKERKMPEAAEELEEEPEQKQYNSSLRSVVLLSVLAVEFYLEKKCYYDFIALLSKTNLLNYSDTYPFEFLRDEMCSCRNIWTRTHSPTVCSL